VKYVSELGWWFASLFGAPCRQLPAQECQAILQTATPAKGARDEPVPQWSAVLGASRGGHDGRQGKEDGHLQAHYQPQASAQEQEQSQWHSERTAHVNSIALEKALIETNFCTSSFFFYFLFLTSSFTFILNSYASHFLFLGCICQKPLRCNNHRFINSLSTHHAHSQKCLISLVGIYFLKSVFMALVWSLHPCKWSSEAWHFLFLLVKCVFMQERLQSSIQMSTGSLHRSKWLKRIV